MGRFNRGMALRPVHRLKHVVDIQGGMVANANTLNTLVTTVDAPVLANVTEVETGSKINGIYLKVEANSVTSAALANFYMYIIKNPGGNITPPSANLVGASDNKRFIIHQEMVMFQQVDNSNPRTIFAGVIAIPRGLRRFAPNDLLQIVVKSPGTQTNFCIQAIYKEFR